MHINKKGADLALLFVTFIWGATFTVVKKATGDIPPFPFLAIRFGIAFISLLPFIYFLRIKIERKAIFQGMILGLILFSGYAWQTLGLQHTTASNAGFITGLSIVFVPLLVSLTSRTLPGFRQISGVMTATAGLALLSLGNNLKLNTGDIMVLFCAFSFAAHIFLTGKYAPHSNPLVLAAGQIFSVAALSGLLALITPQPGINFTSYAWFGIMVTAIPATSMAFFIQTKMQQFTTPTHTALIFASEPVFAALTAYWATGEAFTLRGFIGAALVLAGILIVELKGNTQEAAP